MNPNESHPLNSENLAAMIIQLERSALERWNNGDPSGFLEISANDVVYFDPFSEQRIDGIQNLTKLYESIRGQIKVNNYEMINPFVQGDEKMVVLTYNLISFFNGGHQKWNCTEVYRLENNQWKIIQTHWSFTLPQINN